MWICHKNYTLINMNRIIMVKSVNKVTENNPDLPCMWFFQEMVEEPIELRFDSHEDRDQAFREVCEKLDGQ